MNKCSENWLKDGYCGCKSCEEYGEAFESVWELKTPTSEFGLIKLIREKTGQSAKKAREHVDALIDTGVVTETEKDSGLFIGA